MTLESKILGFFLNARKFTKKQIYEKTFFLVCLRVNKLPLLRLK
jgi:hypothetical protein